MVGFSVRWVSGSRAEPCLPPALGYGPAMREPMTCPGCGGQMVHGRLRVRGTVPGFLFFGLSWQHLWWSDPNETRASRQKLILSGDQRPAERCVSCGMIAFTPFDP